MYLKLDTKFNPLTFDDMVKPLLIYKQAYEKAEEAYNKLSEDTAEIGDLVDRDTSPESYSMYTGFNTDLSNVVDDFSRGMTYKNRRQLLDMRRRYAREIKPIQKASEALAAANTLRDQAGPDAIFQVGRYTSLDDFLHGKSANNTRVSAEQLTKKTAAITEAVMAEAMQDPEFRRVMGDQYWMITQHTGGSYNDLLQAIAENPAAQSRFAQIRQQMLQDVGIENFDAAGQTQIRSAINTGLYAGLDKPVRSFQGNQDHLNPLQVAQKNKLPKYADVSASPSVDEVNSTKFAIASNPIFFDIKNPRKSGYVESATDVLGTIVNYSSLPNSFDSTVKDKASDNSGKETLKEEIDYHLASMYPGASPSELQWIASNYYTIHVTDDANLYFVPKKVSSMPPSSSGTNASGAAGAAIPVD